MVSVFHGTVGVVFTPKGADADIMNMLYAIRLVTLFISTGLLASCAYLESVTKQQELIQNQKTNPRQYNAKHMITRQTYFVYGQIKNKNKDIQRHSVAVVALSNKYRQAEVVDISHRSRMDSYYALNLPAGAYQLLVLEDSNADHVYSEDEIVAQHHIVLNAHTYPDKVAGNIDILLPQTITPLGQKLAVPVSAVHDTQRSLFFPKGTIRTLDDPIFSERIATLGMYDPAAFLENAPMMFYALEEDTPYKIPVIFVHGIGGSAREFQTIVDRLDRQRYKPWFFYYPSGTDLEQLARIFYKIYLSGKVIQYGPVKPAIVAHSMGGLVVREAFNLYQGTAQENKIALFISLASPFGGLSSAQAGVEHAPLVLPAWRDLSPEGSFIRSLFRHSLPVPTSHYLIYAYLESDDRLGSDGVVPVQSQIPGSVLGMISGKYGFESGHAEILQNPAVIQKLQDLLSGIESPFPEEYMYYFHQGGFDVPLDDTYSDLEKRMIRHFGKYLRALANGQLEPIPLNEDFVAVVQGRSKPTTYVDTAWLKFKKDYPTLASATKSDNRENEK